MATAIAKEHLRRDKTKPKVNFHDLLSLDLKTWLNDSIIEAVLHQLSSTAPYKKVICLSPFHYTKLLEKDTTFFTKKINIFQHENVLIPIWDNGKHWILAHYKPAKGIVEVHDPYQNKGQALKVGNTLVPWLLEEAARKDTNITCITLHSSRKYPRQSSRDQYNCGIYITEYARNIIRNEPVQLTNIQQTRQDWKRILKEDLYYSK